MGGRSPYHELKRKVTLEALERFPDTPSKTIARILKRDNPELFKDIEDARSKVRLYRGCHGKEHRLNVRFIKYYKNAMA